MSTSLWSDTFKVKVKSEELKEKLETEVCVIGAGISGLTTAYLLAKAGKKVAVLEAYELGGGETAMTSAHLASALDEGFVELERLFGVEGSSLAAQSHNAAIEEIARIVKLEKVECDFKFVPGYLIANVGKENELDEEYEAAKRSGMKVAKTRSAVFSLFRDKPSLKFAKQAQFHPLKYIAGLIEANKKLGVQFFTNTRATKVEEGEKTVVVTTDDNKKVEAEQVVVATNTPFLDWVTMHTKQAAYRTYVIVAAIAQSDIEEALYWDTDEPYHYVRTYENAGKWYLLVGGEDHKTGQDLDTESHYQALYVWAKQYFPNLGKIAYQWSGQVMEPIDGLAFIGLNPGNKRTYIVTGDSGHGLTHGTIAGMLITDLIHDKKNPWQKLYDPARKNIKAIGTFLKEGVNVAAQYSAYLKEDEIDGVKKLANNTGSVISQKGKKVAVYRDPKGKVHKCSAVCPHLGCIVQWNTGEKSWDCPCHGSRFDAEGKLLNGPAITDLEKL